MGRIKSALEIALERTESVKSDRTSIEQFEAKQAGIRLANVFLGSGQNTKPLEEAIKKAPKTQRKHIEEGVFEVLLSRINLPSSKSDEKQLEAVGKGLQTIITDARFTTLFRQLREALTQYLEESARYEEAIKQQYAPRLKQKEAELSKRMGQPVKIDPFQDPEFVAFYKQNTDALKGNYQIAVDQVREEAVRVFERR
jgi:hypothetical protein